MSPLEYLDQVVRPNLADAHAHYSDVRHCFNAVAAVEALAAHIFHLCLSSAAAEVAEVTRDTDYRDRLARRNPDFELLRDVAKAQKHVELTQGTPLVSGAGQVGQRSLGWGQARWDEGRWDGPPQVVVETDAGELRAMSAVLDGALNFLLGEMRRLGIGS